MKLRTFIERPVLSAVVSLAIVILGLIGLFTLPVEQYPDIAPPTVVVATNYFGASAETLQKSVIAPLEESINGVENMTYMTSTASNSGQVTIFIYFRQGTDPDMAAVNVQNRVAKVTSKLPAEVTQVGVSTVKRQTSMLQVFSLSSPDDSYDEGFLANYISINLKPEILRLQGVGEMVVLGADYSMRIWMKPDVMAQYGLTPADVTAVLAEQNIEAATGTIGENSQETFQYTMKYTGRLLRPEEFDELVIRSTEDGEVLRLRDVADIELGRENYAYVGRLNGHPGVSCLVFQTAGSNATEVNARIDAFLEEARKDLPKGVELTQMMSTNDFLFASIHEVVKTLIEAIILVVLVVLIFLQNFRATLIPLVGIVVSLIGTFAFMSVAGFSINLITLFALVLVIGTVVDDSIVVVEAVQARFDVGYRSPYMASIDAMKGISNAVITSSLVFMAVFIPVSFMSGTSGTFYTQFGLTMAVAVGISAINALTLSPALCALLLKPEGAEEGSGYMARFARAFNSGFAALVVKYRNGVLFFIKRRWLVGGLLICSVALLVLFMNTTKTGLVPDEDQGVVMINVTTPSGVSLATTDKIMQRIAERLKQVPKLKNLMSVSGYSLIGGQGTSAGMFIVRLEDWDERKSRSEQVQAVIGQVYGLTADIKDASIFAMAPAMIPGYGTGNMLDVNMQDRQGGELNDFYGLTQQYIGELNRRPEVARAYTSFAVNYPQWQVSVDAARCKRAGISPNAVLATLSGYYGGQYVSDFNRFSKVYKVMIQADPKFRLDEASLHNAFVRMNDGSMAPLSQFVTLTRVYGAETLTRFNMYNSIAVSVMPAEGYSSGDALRAVKEVASSSLPKGYSFDFGGITREENQQSGTTAVIFGICVLMIYLILSALYESFLIPFAVILAVPAGLMGSFLFAKLMGLENNIYLQTGLIMLIGLLSKTAILLTEYAAERRKSGMSLTSAALSAAKVRLRPILMTVATLVIGLLPLMVASGVGANGNRSLGSGVVGGMLVGTLALLFLVPSLFIVFQYLQERVRPLQVSRSDDWQIQEECEEEAQERLSHLEEKATHDEKHRPSIPGKGLTTICLLLMLPLCSGCGIWNSYKPASEVPDGLYGELPQDMELTAEALTIDTTTLLTDAGWRALFTDPQLQQLIEQGLAQNSDLLTASLRVEEAEAALLSARLAYIPSLTFAPQGTASSFDHAKAVQTYSIPVAAAWEVDLFGRLRNAKRQAKALLLQQQAYRQAVQTRVISSIANTYYTLLMLDAQLDIARTTAESWRQTVSSMKALMEAGMANEAAVAQMEAAHHQVSASVLDLEEQVNSVQNALCLLLSEPAHQVARGSFAEWQFPSTLGVGVPLQLLSRRPDVRIAEQSLAAAYYAAAASRSAFYPAVTLSGSAGWTNSAGSMIVNPGKMLATAVASLTQPIFQRGALLARNKIVVAQQQESALAFRQTLLTAGTEVNEALVQYQTATAKQQHAEAQVASLQRAYDSTRLLMQHGNTTYLEVLTAQQGLLSAQLSQVAVQASRIQSVIALYEALGGEE